MGEKPTRTRHCNRLVTFICVTGFIVWEGLKLMMKRKPGDLLDLTPYALTWN